MFLRGLRILSSMIRTSLPLLQLSCAVTSYICLFQTFIIWVVTVNSHFYLWIKLLNYAVNVNHSCIHQSLSTSLPTFQILKICVFIYKVIIFYRKLNYRLTINQNIAKFNYILNCKLIVEKNMLRCCKHIQQLNRFSTQKV